MNKRATGISERLSGNLRSAALAVLSAMLIFLFAQLVLRNAAYGIPLLVFALVLTSFGESGAWWNAASSAAATLTYYSLHWIFGAEQPLPLYFLVISGLSAVATAVFAGSMSARVREQQTRNAEQTAREKLISEINTHLLTAASESELYEATLLHIYDVSQRASVLYVGSEEGLSPSASRPEGLILYPSEAKAARAAFDSGAPSGIGTGVCEESSFLYLPVRSNGATLAVAGVLCGPERRMEPGMVQTLEMILVRVGVAMDKQRLIKKNQNVLMEKELERIRSDFLRSISHDFRTPLTGIIGACSALGNEGVELDASTKQELIESIGEEAAWLLRMVENLLSVTRVGSSGPKLNKSLEPVEEVLSEAMERTRKRFPEIKLNITQPGEFTMVPMDPTLIVQVLMNLIENAVRYSGGGKSIDVIVEEREAGCAFTVRDYGRGLSEKKLGGLFDPAPFKAGDSAHGMGLGLSICRSVIRAHGGDITGGNSEDGGAVFTFTLPKEDRDD